MKKLMIGLGLLCSFSILAYDSFQIEIPSLEGSVRNLKTYSNNQKIIIRVENIRVYLSCDYFQAHSLNPLKYIDNAVKFITDPAGMLVGRNQTSDIPESKRKARNIKDKNFQLDMIGQTISYKTRPMKISKSINISAVKNCSYSVTADVLSLTRWPAHNYSVSDLEDVQRLKEEKDSELESRYTTWGSYDFGRLGRTKSETITLFSHSLQIFRNEDTASPELFQEQVLENHRELNE